MSAKLVFIKIQVADIDRAINFYRRALGIREVRTWDDPHTEKAVLFDTGAIKLILFKESATWPDPHKPKATKGHVWLGLHHNDLGTARQTMQVGATAGSISEEHDSLLGKGRAFYLADAEGNPMAVVDAMPFGDTAMRPRPM